MPIDNSTISSSSQPPPPERAPKPFLKSRTFAAAEGGADSGGRGPIGTLVRQSLATSERLDTVCVALKTIASLQSPHTVNLSNTLQRVVEERIDRLYRIYEKLGESGDGIMLRFLPGDLIQELNALIEDKEDQLSIVLRSQHGAASLPLCEAFLRGTCTSGVTCNYSHDRDRLQTFVRRWLTAALRLPMGEDGEPIVGGLYDTDATVVRSTTTSEPSTARFGSTQRGGGGGGMSPRSNNYNNNTDDNDLAFGSGCGSGKSGGGTAAGPHSHRRTPMVQPVLTVDEQFGPETWMMILRSLIDYPNVHSLVLRQMPPQALKGLADMLRRNDLDRIGHVDVSRNMLGATYPQGILRLAKALLYNSALTSLDVSFNKLGAPGVLALTQSICDGGAVESVNFGNNGLSTADPAFELWCSLLAKGNLNNLRRMSVAGNRLGGDGAAMLLTSLANSDYCNLTHLDLYHVGLGDRGCRALSQLLTTERSSGPNIRLLNLGWNGITAQGIVSLCQGLEAHTELQILRLHGNPSMGRKGAIALSQLLKSAQELPLTTLDLRWTSPTDDGVASLAEAIHSAKFLTVIDLAHNNLDSRSEALVVEKLKKRPLLMSVDEEVVVTAEEEMW